MVSSSILYQPPPRDLVMVVPLWPSFSSSLHAKNVHIINILVLLSDCGLPASV